MDLAQPGSKRKPNKLEIKSGHQSAPGVTSFFPSSLVAQKYWYLKNAQKDVERRRGDKGWLTAKLGHTVISGYQSAPGGLEWLPLGLESILTCIGLGKMILDPHPSFQAVWLLPQYSYLKNAQKVVECRSGDKGWLTAKLGYTVVAGHQSAPAGLEWLPLGLKNILTRIGLGKMILDPHPSFQAVWLLPQYSYLKNAQKVVECRSGDKGWLTAKLGHTVVAGHQSAPSGLEWLPLGLNSILARIGLGKMILDPHPSFPSGWVEPKRLASQERQKVVECRLVSKYG